MSETRTPPTIRCGTGVELKCEVLDKRVSPPAHFSPGLGVKVSVLDPLGVERLTLAPMTEVSEGFYRYWYQTDESDPEGRWHAWVKAQNGTEVVMTLDVLIFVTALR